jgi:gamma-glutamylcyclotransferase (GGCT)/AIG2-like uncharacterized protein YtfP
MGLRYFFYGTLMDGDVLDQVVGRRVAAADKETAEISGFRRVYRIGASYPVLVPQPEETVPGQLAHRITPAEAARLARFEGGDYRPMPTLVRAVSDAGAKRAVTAIFFLPALRHIASRRRWDFADWQRREKPRYLDRIARVHLARP